MFLWWIIPFAGQETAEGIFLLGIIPIKFIGIIDKGYPYSYNR